MPGTAVSAPHLLAYATPHGYGHAAILRAVLVAFLQQYPNASVTLISEAPEAFFAGYFSAQNFHQIHRRCAGDFGLLMTSSLSVSRQPTLAAYHEAFANWSGHIHQEANWIRAQKPDLVLTCGSCLPLPAAREVGVPSFTVGPFTWVDILQALWDDDTVLKGVLDPMEESYRAAEAFFVCDPAVPSACANPRGTLVGPIGLPSVSYREELRDRLKLRDTDRVAIVTLGGIPENVDLVGKWPCQAGWRWIVAGLGRSVETDAVVSTEALGLSVGQAIASCDAVITKPGYGTFVEAACAGVPVLYRDRPGWPETQGLADFIARYAGVACIDEQQYASGALVDLLNQVVAVPRHPPARPVGNQQVVDGVAAYLDL